MALSATIFHITVELADIDRSVYETLELKLARHPSETMEYMVTRLLAYCLEYTEGIEFTPGLSSTDEPAIVVRDLTGRITTWIEVGLPDAERLHRASKAADHVAVYTHREIRLLLAQLEGRKIHRRDELAVYAVDRHFIDDIATHLERRTRMSLSVTEQHVYSEVAGHTSSCVIERVPV